MLLTLLVACAVIFSGALVSYFYAPRAVALWRLAAGSCTGLAVHALVTFIIASFAGMTPATLLVSTLLAASPLLLLLRPAWRERVQADWRASLRSARGASNAGRVFYPGIAVLLALVFQMAMYERLDGIYTGTDNNIGDLPLHLSIITGFASGDNFPPQHTEYAGVRMAYPFLVDFGAGVFVRLGATLGGSLLIQNLLLAFAFVSILHAWARELTRSELAARLALALALFSGGLGWWMLAHSISTGGLAALVHLPQNYSVTPAGAGYAWSAWTNNYRWGNTLTALLVPQRGLLLGAPLFLLACTLLLQSLRGEDVQADELAAQDALRERRNGRRDSGAQRRKPDKARRKAQRRTAGKAAMHGRAEAIALNAEASESNSTFATRRLIAAGVIAGVLPLVHAHSFALLMAVSLVLVVLFWHAVSWRAWGAFFAIALMLAVPQLVWVTRDTPVQTSSFIAWQFGWDRGDENVLWFWLKNTGAFLPLLVIAFFWRREDATGGGDAPLLGRRAQLFYVPVACIFVGANVLRLAPWIWDNIKVLFLWFILSAPIVALLLTHWWRRGGAWTRIAVAALVVSLTAAGALDVLRVITGAAAQRVFSREDINFAALVERTTPPRSRILHAPVYNHPALLTGRRSLLGYPGHLWSHGIDYTAREAEVKAIYAGAPEADAMLRRNQVDYLVVSPHERGALTVNDEALGRYTLVAEQGDYRLYRVTAK